MASPTEESLLLDWPPLLEDTDAVGGNFPLFPVPQLASFDIDQLFQTPPEAIVPSTSDANQQSESSVSLKVKVNDDYELVSEPDPRKNQKEGLVNGAG